MAYKTNNINKGSNDARATQVDDSRAGNNRASFERETSSRQVDTALKQRFQKVMFKNRLDIPEDIVNRFEAQGFKLSWMRYKFKQENTVDHENIYKKTVEEMAEFVRPDEIPEVARAYSRVGDTTYGDMVTRGDLALVKTPIDAYLARREVKEDRVREVTEGILDRGEGRPTTAKTNVSTTTFAK